MGGWIRFEERTGVERQAAHIVPNAAPIEVADDPDDARGIVLFICGMNVVCDAPATEFEAIADWLADGGTGVYEVGKGCVTPKRLRTAKGPSIPEQRAMGVSG